MVPPGQRRAEEELGPASAGGQDSHAAGRDRFLECQTSGPGVSHGSGGQASAFPAGSWP